MRNQKKSNLVLNSNIEICILKIVLAIQILKFTNSEIIKCLIIFTTFIFSMYQHETAFPYEKLKLKEGSAWSFSFTKSFVLYIFSSYTFQFVDKNHFTSKQNVSYLRTKLNKLFNI